jgi:PiT family inorganic phosphate transporter
MDIPLALVIFTVALAIVFDLVNGFHDAANSIATIVSTRVLPPSYAVAWAAFFNFIAILFFAPHVADTISKIVRIESQDIAYVYVILTGLASAILWNILTWRLGLPTSSSHALIGGLAGSGIAFGGWNALYWEKLIEIAAFIIVAPLLGFILGLIFMWIVFVLFAPMHPSSVNRIFSKGQLVSAALYSIGHGANDAQKTMGIIMALLIASGHFTQTTELSLENPQTAWIIIVCQLAMALGTGFGGWRIVKTMGMKIVKLKPVGGFCAETAGAVTLFTATHFGIPVSTTHTIIGSIIGVGTMSNPLSKIKWWMAVNIMWSWILTLPSTALLAWLLFHLLT